MGSLCSTKKNGSMVGGSAALQVDAPAEVLWKHIVDVDAYPKILSSVVSIERQDRGDLHVGSKWREVRKYRGRSETVVDNFVTSISEDPFSISLGNSFSGIALSNSAMTSTVAVEALDDSSCLMVGSFAYKPAGMIPWLIDFFFRSCIHRDARNRALAELEDYAAAAKASVTGDTQYEAEKVVLVKSC